MQALERELSQVLIANILHTHSANNILHTYVASKCALLNLSSRRCLIERLIGKGNKITYSANNV